MLKTFYSQFGNSYIQTFSDKKDGDKSLIQQFPMSEIKEKFNDIKELNSKGAGIYFTPNPCKGGRKRENLESIQWVFCDLDGGDKQSMLDKVNKSPRMPDIIVESKNGYHLYWKCECEEEYFDKIVRGLIEFFDADPACKDPNRVLRLPGFNHMKEDPYVIKIQHLDIIGHDYMEMVLDFPAPEKEIVEFKDQDEDIRKIKEIPVKEILKDFGVSWNRQNEILDHGGKATSAVIKEHENYVNRFSGKDGSGSTIDVAMAYGNMNKPDAIKWLKEKIGIDKKEIVNIKPKKVDKKKRFTWGTDEMNKKFPVIKQSYFGVMVGEVNNGKTTYAHFMARKNADMGNKVLFLSLEMDTEDLHSILARKYSGITTEEEYYDRIPDNKQTAYERKKKELEEMDNLKLIGVNRGDPVTWDHIKKLIAENNDCDIVFIDNLNSLMFEGQNKYEEQEKVINSIMGFTNDKKIPIIMLHHYRKSGGGKSPKNNDDVQGSGKIVQGADMIVSISRNMDENATGADKIESLIKITKARGYDLCYHKCYFNKGDYQDDVPYEIRKDAERIAKNAQDIWYNN